MRPDLRNRILANILFDPQPEPILLPRRRRVTAGSLVSMAIAAAAAFGLVLLIFSKLHSAVQ